MDIHMVAVQKYQYGLYPNPEQCHSSMPFGVQTVVVVVVMQTGWRTFNLSCWKINILCSLKLAVCCKGQKRSMVHMGQKKRKKNMVKDLHNPSITVLKSKHPYGKSMMIMLFQTFQSTTFGPGDIIFDSLTILSCEKKDLSCGRMVWADWYECVLEGIHLFRLAYMAPQTQLPINQSKNHLLF